MKNWISCVLINLAFSLLSFGQNEIPLLQPNYSWDVYFWEPGITLYSSGNRQFIAGDTLIDGVQYQVIKGQELTPVSQPVFFPPFELEASQRLIGFMREDLQAQKVYSRGVNTDSKEYLTYDFSLEIGDTLLLEYLDQTVIVLDTIEEISLPGGLTRRQFVFRDNDFISTGNNQYIEGLGGSSTLLFPFDFNFEFGADIGCVRSGNTSIYGTECLSVVNAKEPPILPFARLYPNPTTDEVFIDLGENKEVQCRLFDTNGRLMLHQVIDRPRFSLTLSSIASGLYFIELETTSGIRQMKLIKR